MLVRDGDAQGKAGACSRRLEALESMAFPRSSLYDAGGIGLSAGMWTEPDRKGMRDKLEGDHRASVIAGE